MNRPTNSNSSTVFENRKKEHLSLSLQSSVQAEGLSGLDQIQLIHEALPEINFEDIDISTDFLGSPVPTPFFVSSMTAGHKDGESINQIIGEACEKTQWPMGVGSQRKELSSSEAANEWKNFRKKAPHVKILSNIGISQLIQSDLSQISSLVNSVGAEGLFVHTNPLQEALQPEGTPQFKGGLEALRKLCRELDVPVILKETGCGISGETALKLCETGLYAIDVSGLGGTHWGRIEGLRSKENSILRSSSESFKNWGISTAQSLLEVDEVKNKSQASFQVWASGGVRSGLDAAKLIALGAKHVGIAQPLLKVVASYDSRDECIEALIQCMKQFEFELKLAMFCTGSVHIEEFQEKVRWQKV